MALTVNHAKTDNIADWTQADLDAEIAAGNFPAGTVLNDIVLPSDWNDDHTLSMETNKLLGRGTAGTGAVEEVSIGTGLALSGTTLNATGAANSFVTIATPAGTSPVADSATDTLTLTTTEATAVVTGNSTTDTINIHVPGALVHPTTGSTYEYSLKPASITGQRNTMIGVGTGTSIQGSNENTGFGYNVLRSTINGLTGTTGVGYAAWANLQTGQYCTQVGYDNFTSLTSGDLLTVLGVSNAGSALTASGCSIVGQLNATSATTLTAAQIFGRVIAPSATTITEANLFGKDICTSAPYITTVNAFGKDLATWIDAGTQNLNLLGNAMVQGADTDVNGSTFVGAQIVNSDRMAISNCSGVGSNIFSGADSSMSDTVAVGSGIFECDSSSSILSSYALGQNINANGIVSNLAYTVFVGANLGSALSYSNYNLLIGFDMISQGNASSILSSVLLGSSIGVNNSDPQITNSVIIGPAAGQNVTSIDGEIYIGQAAGGQITNSFGNSFIGSYAGYGVTSGIGNIAIGPSAMVGIDTSSSIAIGYQAGGSWNGGSYLFMGTNTGYSGAGDYVIGLGIEALTACGTVSRTIAIGAGAGGFYSTDVSDCVLIGQNCEASSTTATNEFCVGSDVSPTYTYRLGWGGKPSTSPAGQTVTITPTVSSNGTVGADLELKAGQDNNGGVEGNVKVFGTGAVIVPVGTTAQRPTGVQGMIRYNTTTSKFEGYDGGSWKDFY